MYISITMTFSLIGYTGNRLYSRETLMVFFVKYNISYNLQMTTDLGKILLKSIRNKYSNIYEKKVGILELAVFVCFIKIVFQNTFQF